MKRFTSKAALAGLALFLIKPVWAAPSISGVSGTFSGNADSTSANVITISGTGFGSKSPAAPYCWYTGEVGVSTEPSSLGQVTNWSASQHMTSTTTAATGSKAVCSDDTWLTDASNKQWNVQLDFNLGYATKYFLSYDHRVTYTEGSGLGNWKWQRWWEVDGAQPDHYVGTQGNSDETVQQEGNGTVVFLNGVWIHPADRGKTWTKEEYRWQLNSAQNVADGGWKIWMWDNNKSSANWKSDAAGAGGTPDNVFLEDDPSNFTPAWSFAMLDNVYADSSWARVVVGSSATYDGSYRREMMIPKTWSTTSITAYFHQGGFANGTTAYVYVCDSNDSCNATGSSIVINGSGSNSPPTADAGVDQTITLPAAASLDGTSSDDVAVTGSTWSMTSGSGSCTFGNANAEDTTATFSSSGTKVLTYMVTDGSLTASDTVQITVNDPPPAPPSNLRGNGYISGGGIIKSENWREKHEALGGIVLARVEFGGLRHSETISAGHEELGGRGRLKEPGNRLARGIFDPLPGSREGAPARGREFPAASGRMGTAAPGADQQIKLVKILTSGRW